MASLVKAKARASNLQEKNLDFATIAGMTEGYQPADLRDLVDRSIHQAAIRSKSDSLVRILPSYSTMHPLIYRTQALELTLDDFTAAQVGFVPLSLRDVKLQKSEVQWADIGGLHETRRVLRETLEWPTKYGAIFASCPLRLRSGSVFLFFPLNGRDADRITDCCSTGFLVVERRSWLQR